MPRAEEVQRLHLAQQMQPVQVVQQTPAGLPVQQEAAVRAARQTTVR
jgi:hypothetical protein